MTNMKSALTVTVSLVLLCTLCDALPPWEDPCTVMPGMVGSGIALTDEGGEAEVPSQCTNGSVWWNYPRGTLSVTFTQTRPFTVCLASDIGPWLEAMHQVVNGQSVTMDNPQEEGQEACTPTADTTVQVLLDAPSFMTYMTLYTFRIQFQQ